MFVSQQVCSLQKSKSLEGWSNLDLGSERSEFCGMVFSAGKSPGFGAGVNGFAVAASRAIVVESPLGSSASAAKAVGIKKASRLVSKKDR